MKERPILFSGPMVRAILEGRKTQTRRVVKPQPEMVEDRTTKPWEGCPATLLRLLEATGRDCPYGQPGDRLWVREAFMYSCAGAENERGYDDCIEYRADFGKKIVFPGMPHADDIDCKWRPSIHMPRWASRITLEVTGARVERLQQISETDAQAEGARWKEFGRCGSGFHLAGWSMDDPFPESHAYCLNTAPLAFANYINRLHGGDNWNLKPSNLWAENPWVWVVEFRKI